MDALGIEIKDGTWDVVHLKGSLFGVKLESRFTLDAASAEERAAELKGYLSHKGVRKCRVAVALGKKSCISRVLDVPAPGPDAIQGILRFEMEKHLPYPTEEAYISSRILSRDKNIFTVYVVAARKEAVDAAAAAVGGAGLAPDLIGPRQAFYYNALYHLKKVGPASRTAFVELEPDSFTVDVFSGLTPVYSKGVFTGAKPWAEWGNTLKRELKSGAGYLKGGRDDKALSECVLVPCGREADEAMEAEMASWSSMRVVNGGLLKGSGVESDGAAAYGAAISALDLGVIELSLGRSLSSAGAALTARLGMLAAALIVAVGVSYIARDYIAIARFEGAVDEMTVKKEKMDILTGSVKSMDDRVRALDAVKGVGKVGPVEALAELSEILPSNTWLTSFEYSNGVVNAEGLSRSASSTLFTLEKSRLLKEFEFTGQITKKDGLEHFKLKCKARGPA